MTGIIKSKIINFDHDKIPVRNRSLPRVIDVPLTSIIPDQYTLMINATNQIGTATVYNNTFYVPGKIVYMCVCVCKCLYQSLSLCICVSVSASMSVPVTVFVCDYMYVCLCVCVCVSVSVTVCDCVFLSVSALEK